MRLLIVSLSFIVIISGCVQPDVTKMEVHWGKITDSYSELKAEIALNDIPFLFPLSDIESTVYINGIEIAQGHAEKIESNRAVLSIKIDNERIRDLWVAHMKSNETSEILIKVRPVISLFTIHIGSSEKFVETLKTDIFGMDIDDVKLTVKGKEIFAIKDITIKRGETSNLDTKIILSGKVVNNGMIDVEITKIEYEVVINGVLAGKGINNAYMKIRSGESKNFKTILFLDNKKIPEWWVKHLKNGERSDIILRVKVHTKAGLVEGVVNIEQRKTFTTSIAGSLIKI